MDTKSVHLKISRFPSQLSYKVLLITLIASTIFTTVFTAISFYLDYNTEMDQLETRIKQAQASMNYSLVDAVWRLDTEQIKNLLKGMTEIESIAGASFVQQNGDVVVKVDNHALITNSLSTSLTTRSFPILQETEGQYRPLGELHLSISSASLRARLVHRLVYFLLTQTLKTLFISTLMLWILNTYVIRHLKTMVAFFRDFAKNPTISQPEMLKLAGGHSTDMESLTQSIANMHRDLLEYQSRLLKEKEDKVRIASSMETARAVQNTLLPPLLDIAKNVRCAMKIENAEHVGGDWFDYHRHNRHVYLFVADVSGQGISASLVTALLSGAVKAALQLVCNQALTVPEVLDQVAHTANDVIFRTSRRTSLLCTMGIVAINLDTGEVAYLSAGHCPLLHKQGDTITEIKSAGLHLGYTATPAFEISHLTLQDKDFLVIHTDGILDNQGPLGQKVERESLIEFVRAGDSPHTTRDTIVAHAQRTWAEHPLSADYTLVVFQWFKP